MGQHCSCSKNNFTKSTWKTSPDMLLSLFDLLNIKVCNLIIIKRRWIKVAAHISLPVLIFFSCKIKLSPNLRGTVERIGSFHKIIWISPFFKSFWYGWNYDQNSLGNFSCWLLNGCSLVSFCSYQEILNTNLNTDLLRTFWKPAVVPAHPSFCLIPVS